MIRNMQYKKSSTGTSYLRRIQSERTMRIYGGIALLALLLLVKSGRAATLSNPNAIQEATDTYNYINNQKGTKIISGSHDINADNVVGGLAFDYDLNVLIGITGKRPKMMGLEMGIMTYVSDAKSDALRQDVVNYCKSFYKAGGIPTLSWHSAYPGAPTTATSWTKPPSTFNFHDAVTPGNATYNALIADIDKIGTYLKQLSDAKVPVLWRPYHEMNASWFWWGARNSSDFKALWQLMYNRYKSQGINNLIWVWSPFASEPSLNNSDYTNFYPGDAYVDILACDIYHKNADGAYNYQKSYYDTMKAWSSSSGGKPIAIGECDDLPTLATQAEQPDWAYFLGWGLNQIDYNTNDELRAVYNSDRVIKLGVTTDRPGDLARLATATASRDQANAAKAVDIANDSYWSTGSVANSWVYVDLGSAYTISRVKLTWWVSPSSYKVQVKDANPGDDSGWTDVASVSGGKTDLAISDFILYTGLTSASGRYVRFKCLSADDVHLKTFEVYGNPYTIGSNLVSNPGFEAEQFDTQTPSGWSELQYDANWASVAATASYTESNGGSASGVRHGTHWSSGAYRVYTYQIKTGLINGLYTLRAKARRSNGTPTACYLEAKDFGGSARMANIPVSSTYQPLEIKDINVANGQCTIGIWSNANAGNWCYFDDFEFFKQ